MQQINDYAVNINDNNNSNNNINKSEGVMNEQWR